MPIEPSKSSQRRQRRKRAVRETKALFQALFESSPDAVVIADSEGSIVRVNAQAEALFGYSPDELLGQPIETLIPERFHALHVAHRANYRAAPQTRPMGRDLNLFGKRKDGSEFPADISLSPFNADGLSGVIAVVRDVTERKYAEEHGRLLTSLAMATSEAEDFLTLLNIVLMETCQATGWVMGEIWQPRADGSVLECSPVWHAGMMGLEELRWLSQGLTFAPGVGLPGRAWASKSAVWFEDVTTDPAFVRQEAAAQAGLKSAVGIPVLAGEEVVAVLTFFSRELRPRDQRMISMISTIALQLSAAFQHKRAADTVRRQRDELAARARIISATLRTRDFGERLNIILREAMTFLGVEMGCVHVVMGNEVLLRCWGGISDELRAHLLSFPADHLPLWMREPYVVHEPLSESGAIPNFAKREGVQAMATVPLTLTPDPSPTLRERGEFPEGSASPLPQRGRGVGGEGKWLGTLMLGSRRLDALNEEDVFALQAIAEQLALAIDHAHHYHEAERRLMRLSVLREIDRAIIVYQSVRDILRVVLEQVPKDLGAEAIAVSLLDADPLRARVFVMRLPNDTVVEEEAFTLADSLLHWFVDRKEPVIIHDLTQDPRAQMHRERIRHHQLISYLGVPLVALDKTVGILHLLTTQPKMFAEEDVDFFRTLAGQAAIAIENSRMFEEATQRAQALEKMVASMVAIAGVAPEQAPAFLVRAFQEVTRCDHVGYYRFDGTTQTLTRTEVVGCTCPPERRELMRAEPPIRLDDERSFASQVARTRKPFYLSDCHADPRWRRANPAVRSAYFLPLLFGERLFGVIVLLDNELSAFSSLRRSLADTFATYAAAAMEAARLLEQTRAAEQKYRSIFENAVDGIFQTTPDGRFLTVNPAGAHIMGYESPEELITMVTNVAEQIYVDPNRRAELLRLLNEQRRVTGFEIQARRKDGSIIWGSLSVVAVRDREGLALYYEGSVEDVTQRKRADEVLQQQFMRISLLNQITRAIAERHDLHSIFQATLRRLEDHLPIDLGGVHLYDAQSNTFTVAARSPKGQSLAAQLGTPEGTVVPVECSLLRACLQGEVVYVPDIAQVEEFSSHTALQAGLRSAVAVPLMVQDKVMGVLVASRRDVDGFSSAECEFLRVLSEHVALAAHQTQLHESLQRAYDDLRQTREAVMQQERLRALGQMASGIAHDVNNAISPIVGYAELLLMTPEENLSERARRYIETIKTAGTDIAHIVARMREFYRQRTEQEELFPFNLNRLVRQVIDLTRPRWKDIPQQRGIVIDVVSDLCDDLPEVLGLESEIREALTNLIFNAVDAMPDSGTVTIRTSVECRVSSVGETTGEPSPVTRHPSLVMLSVSDTGVGMTEETRQRCLEPFFSTKGERGTGLGLAMVYGTMQRHDGDIQIESALGKGTTARLIFPAREPVEVGVPEVVATSVAPPLRILFIDDEPLLRQLMKELLEADGHTVEIADGGQAGLDAFRSARERGEAFEVVITDLGMPHVSGREVARTVKRESPRTPVILQTGWGTRLGIEGDVPAEVDAVLSKPPRITELRDALRRVAMRP